MPQQRRANALWLGMILAGAALAAFVYLAWPESTFRLVRLPYGESMPKTPVAQTTARAERAAAQKTEIESAPIVVAPAQASAPRELAVAEPESSPEGPPPVPSESEADGYTESAEELGAEPLPGMGPQPEPAAADHTAAPPTGEADGAKPLVELVIEP